MSEDLLFGVLGFFIGVIVTYFLTLLSILKRFRR